MAAEQDRRLMRFDPVVAAGALLGLMLGVVGGYVAGKRYRDNGAATYWGLNAAAFALGVAVDAVGLYVGAPGLAVAGIGLLGGALTGLKYGRAKVVRDPLGPRE